MGDQQAGLSSSSAESKTVKIRDRKGIKQGRVRMREKITDTRYGSEGNGNVVVSETITKLNVVV